MKTIVVNSEQETKSLAKKIASYLTTGDLIVLTGDLGSGKTKFTEGFLSYFGLEDEISSPTFTIVNEYQKDSLLLYHFDVYRLSSSDEFYAIGGEQYLDQGLCIMEWGEQIQEVLPKEYLQIIFSRDLEQQTKRTLTFQTFGKKYAAIVETILRKES